MEFTHVVFKSNHLQGSMVEHLPSISEALGYITSTGAGRR